MRRPFGEESASSAPARGQYHAVNQDSPGRGTGLSTCSLFGGIVGGGPVGAVSGSGAPALMVAGGRGMLTLFGTLDSGNVHKVQMILTRIGATYRRVDVAQTRDEPRDERFLAVNPMGKVPAGLREDGHLLSESGAILYHFARETPLWPTCRFPRGPPGRSRGRSSASVRRAWPARRDRRSGFRPGTPGSRTGRDRRSPSGRTVSNRAAQTA